jgi:hypothetical protein
MKSSLLIILTLAFLGNSAKAALTESDFAGTVNSETNISCVQTYKNLLLTKFADERIMYYPKIIDSTLSLSIVTDQAFGSWDLPRIVVYTAVSSDKSKLYAIKVQTKGDLWCDGEKLIKVLEMKHLELR